MLPEYDFSEGVRGKYAERYRRSTNVVAVDDDLREEFPNTEAVNDAIWRLLRRREEDRLGNAIEADDLRAEYDFSEAMASEYAGRYRRSTNVIVIDDDLRKDFPNAEAVNDALRELLRIRRDDVG